MYVRFLSRPQNGKIAGMRWHTRKNQQSQTIAGFRFLVPVAGLEPARF